MSLASGRFLTNATLMTRRALLGRSAAFGAMGMLAATGFSPAMAQTPKRGGKFTVALGHGSTTDSLDPETNAGSGFNSTFNFTLYNCLVETVAGGGWVPELAETVEPSADAKVWTLKLRKGIQFHDGRPLTAQDVLNSINIHRREGSKSSMKPTLAVISDVRADGDTITFELSAANADLPYLLASFTLPILPAKGDGVDWEAGVGTGPYKLTKFDPGVRSTFTRNENYWKADRAFFDEVEILTVADQAARTNALATGAVDAIDRADLNTVDMLSGTGNVEVIETNGGTHFTLPMNATVAPFDNLDVRLALKYAIDRKAIVDTILSGHGIVANDNPIAPTNRYFDPTIPQRPYDPEKAKFHLDKAGMSGLTVDINISDAAFAGAVDTAVLFSERAKAAGITLNVVREPADGYWSNVWMQKPFTASYWGGQPTADLALSQAYASTAAWNEGFWKNARFDELLVAARGELDEARRKEMYGEMQRLITDEGSVIIPMFSNDTYAISTGLGHGELQTLWPLDTRRCCERWWRV